MGTFIEHSSAPSKRQHYAHITQRVSLPADSVPALRRFIEDRTDSWTCEVMASGDEVSGYMRYGVVRGAWPADFKKSGLYAIASADGEPVRERQCGCLSETAYCPVDSMEDVK